MKDSQHTGLTMAKGYPKELIAATIKSCRERNYPPLQALRAIALVTHPKGGGVMARYRAELWIGANGEPTYDKLISWAAGYACGHKDGTQQERVSPDREYPTTIGAKRGEEVGFYAIQNKRTGDTSFIVYGPKSKHFADRLFESCINDERLDGFETEIEERTFTVM